MKKILLILTSSALAACSYLQPDYKQKNYDNFNVYDNQLSVVAYEAEYFKWRNFFSDYNLQNLIELGLKNNKDLRIASLNNKSMQALYQIQRADFFPSIGASAGGNVQKVPQTLSQTGNSYRQEQYNVGLGTSWELDLFGKVASLNEKALQSYLASTHGLKAAQISLIAGIASSYYKLRADMALFELAKQTSKAYQESFDLTQKMFDSGISDKLSFAQASIALEAVNASLAGYELKVIQDKNSISNIIGVDAGNVLDGLTDDFNDLQLADIPHGVSSKTLQNRPDIIQAEYNLKAANAAIGAARAAFFPSISLTANTGYASSELNDLFKSNAATWSFSPQINLPIFNSGKLRANLDYTKLQKHVAVANYEKSIQNAFLEVSNTLNAQHAYKKQYSALQKLVDASSEYESIANKRFNIGIDSRLVLLDAQRNLFSAREQLINSRLAALLNNASLYKAFGGGFDQK